MVSSPYFTGLQCALDVLRQQSPAAALRYPDLTSLLSGSPITQHDLAEGVFERQFTGLLGRLQTARHQARLLSKDFHPTFKSRDCLSQVGFQSECKIYGEMT